MAVGTDHPASTGAPLRWPPCDSRQRLASGNLEVPSAIGILGTGSIRDNELREQPADYRHRLGHRLLQALLTGRLRGQLLG